MRPLRILFVSSSGQFGGAELALDTYLAHLPAGVDGHALVIGPGPLAATLAQRLGRPVATCPLAGRPGAREAVGVVRGVHAFVRRVRPDVVHATGHKAAVLAAPGCRAARVPLIWHKVDFSRDALLAGPLAAACAGVIPISAAVAATVPARRRLESIPPPVRLDPAFRVSRPRPPAVLGSVGRLLPYKGHADVIAAAAQLRERFPDVEVLVAGGPDRSAPGHGEELLAYAARLGMGDRVRLLGHVADVASVYTRLTVLVQATYRDERGYGVEGFGASLAEAGWAGLPVVATLGGGAAEVVDDGRTGRLVPARDVVAIGDAVAGYLADPAAAAAAGDAAAQSLRGWLAPGPLAERLIAVLGGVTG